MLKYRQFDCKLHSKLCTIKLLRWCKVVEVICMLKLILVNFQGYIKLVVEKYKLFSNANIEVLKIFYD